jgi:L-lactate dehydrogenase complex protein LldG
VPPVHIALPRPERVFDTLHWALRELGRVWGLLPSAGRSTLSKTADIEQTLAYGVHEPKRLVMVVLAT